MAGLSGEAPLAKLSHVGHNGVMSERERSPTVELWDKYQVAEYLGIQPNSARRIALRHGIKVVARRIDERGRAYVLYRADDIRNHRSSAG
jgi:hypothetical protein